MIEQNKSLVPVVEPELGTEHLTPYVVFYRKLMQRCEILNRKHRIYTWSRFPVNKALPLGFWLLLQKLTSKRSIKVGLNRRAMALLRRADLQISAGLSLAFNNNMDDAVSAFTEEVINQVLRNVKPGAQDQARLFGVPVAKFFIRMMKVCQKQITSYRYQIKDVLEQNHIQRKIWVATTGIDKFKDVLDAMELDYDPTNVPQKSLYSDDTRRDQLGYLRTFLNLGYHIRAARLETERLRSLPVNICRIPLRVMTVLQGRSVAYEWINTQILLASLGEEGDTIGLRDYSEAVFEVKRLNSDRVLKLVQDRMTERGFEGSEDKWLVDLLQDRISFIQSDSVHGRATEHITEDNFVLHEMPILTTELTRMERQAQELIKISTKSLIDDMFNYNWVLSPKWNESHVVF